MNPEADHALLDPIVLGTASTRAPSTKKHLQIQGTRWKDEIASFIILPPRLSLHARSELVPTQFTSLYRNVRHPLRTPTHISRNTCLKKKHSYPESGPTAEILSLNVREVAPLAAAAVERRAGVGEAGASADKTWSDLKVPGGRRRGGMSAKKVVMNFIMKHQQSSAGCADCRNAVIKLPADLGYRKTGKAPALSHRQNILDPEHAPGSAANNAWVFTKVSLQTTPLAQLQSQRAT
ncbi:hypothetical protein DFH09DRAFT_1103307 [Mycena vulgaris]|nr:hypothetical protein DFH09DRAFT_1103307 [Mycena vulgaris]